MAKAKKLKVFRTAIGFHDAYVAAPSRKAALEAWGAGSNLFAAGAAEEVDDAKLMKAALERPGAVVRVLRGSAAEQVAALSKSGVSRRKDRPTPNPSRKREGSEKKAPRPSWGAVEKAEAALARGEARHRAALEKLRAAEAVLARRRREIETEQRDERAALSAAVDESREHYRAAMAEWAG